ncbi:VOC family protein [uncultured Paenibacillus sp.]|uniref:VOC family protein n=1 Tax=uncultured Paenibacillus sp. TaxID=227322 RepID=UPI0015AA40BE|nr:VOC family protein [uncultured Paenibacillus sp.]
MPKQPLPPATHIGPVSLTISDMEKSLAFYRTVLGLHGLTRSGRTAVLGSASGRPLIALTEHKAAPPREAHAAGLDHLAILAPNRSELAGHLERMLRHEVSPQMIADHGVNESLYLQDPDGILIEITRDFTPEELAGHSPLGSRELAHQLLELGRKLGGPAPPGVGADTQIGHILLRVTGLREAEQFYTREIGFDVSLRLPGAVFVSAGRYHHHVGFHVWETDGGLRADVSAIGLRHFTILVPDSAAPNEAYVLRDPAGNGLAVTSPGNVTPERLIEIDQTLMNRKGRNTK